MGSRYGWRVLKPCAKGGSVSQILRPVDQVCRGMVEVNKL